MTELLCHTDSYLKEFQAQVTQVTEVGVVLDRTAPPSTPVVEASPATPASWWRRAGPSR